MEKFHKISKVNKDIFCCPECHADLKLEDRRFLCVRSRDHGPFIIDSAGRFIFIEQKKEAEYQQKHQSGVNSLKSFFKRWPRVYYLIWHIVCPVLFSGKGPGSVIKLLPPGALILNLGSGPRRLWAGFINVDVFPFKEVDVVADVHKLPFKDSSVDAIVNESLFEHLPQPLTAVKEIERVLKPGGILYTSTPFLTPYHASPDDFTRWTRSGLRSLFDGFEIIKDGVSAGPWSAFLVFMSYWLGVIFSFGSKRAAPFFGIFFMIFLGPLKFLDFFFARFPGADAVAAHFYFIGKKQ